MSKEERKDLPDVEIGTAADMDEVMRKYDRESATRIWEGKPKVVVSVISALFSLYCVWSTLWSTADLPIRLTAFLGLIIIMGYLNYPARKGHVTPNRMPWYDIVVMFLGAGSFSTTASATAVWSRSSPAPPKSTPPIRMPYPARGFTSFWASWAFSVWRSCAGGAWACPFCSWSGP